MLDILGANKKGYCDRISRRNALKIGAMGVGGLMLSDVLRAEAQQGIGSSKKALINIHLGGGPSHQDMWDLKPDAPTEYRGEFTPISTNVPGMDICELFPKLSKMGNRFALIRGLVGSVNEHSSNTALTGYKKQNLENAGGRPSNGSVISKLCEGSENPAPPFVSMMSNVSPGYLGPLHQPYKPDGVGRSNLQMNTVTADRLADRRTLLKQMDRMRRESDNTGKMEAMDEFSARAVDIVASGKMADALDYQKESAETIKRYMGHGQGRYRDNRNFLLARRLIEAGVRCVAMQWGGWDTHNKNFDSLRAQLPAMDAGLSALLTDFYDRGMLDDVTIVVWGEFGRTPKVNGNAGRDHWPRVAAAWLAGGGMKTGQVIGESDRYAGEAIEPVHLHNVHATLYHNMGINPETQQFLDRAGRPQYLLDERKPITELI